jgi:hypothetical protein
LTPAKKQYWSFKKNKFDESMQNEKSRREGRGKKMEEKA